VSDPPKAYGRFATFALGAIALLTGQMAALLALTAWFGNGIGGMPEFNGDGVAITLVIAASTPVEILLLVLLPSALAKEPLVTSDSSGRAVAKLYSVLALSW